MLVASPLWISNGNLSNITALSILFSAKGENKTLQQVLYSDLWYTTDCVGRAPERFCDRNQLMQQKQRRAIFAYLRVLRGHEYGFPKRKGHSGVTHHFLALFLRLTTILVFVLCVNASPSYVFFLSTSDVSHFVLFFSIILFFHFFPFSLRRHSFRVLFV